jgi:hypothetical protein
MPTKKNTFAALVVFSCLSALLMAQKAPAPSATPEVPAGPMTPVAPDIVVNGFKEFKSGGYTAAINAWSRDSSLMLDSPTLQSLNNYFSLISNNSGTYVGADMVRVVNLSPNSEIVYAAAKYQRQVVFISFTCYKAGDRWLITVIDANKDPTKVLPTNILSGQ